MSQQEMHYSEPTHQQGEQDYASYDGLPPHNPSQSQFSTPYRQKLSSPTENQHPSPTQRLILALVSLGMFMIMILSLIFLGLAFHIDSGNIFVLLLVTVLFFVAVIVINALFNRKH